MKSASGRWLKFVMAALLNSEGIYIYKWAQRSEPWPINQCNDVEAAAATVPECL